MMRTAKISDFYADLVTADFNRSIIYHTYDGERATERLYALDSKFIIDYLVNFTERKFFYPSDLYTAREYFRTKFQTYITTNEYLLDNIITALMAKYNPVYNYSMTEDQTEEHSPLYDNNGNVIGGKRTEKSGITHRDITISPDDITTGNHSTDSVTTSGDVTHSTTTYESAQLRTADKDANSASTTSDTGDVFGAVLTKDETTSYKNTLNHSRYGNIGVTTSAQMVKEILDLYKEDAEEIVINGFLDLYTWDDGGLDWIDWSGLE